MKFKKASYRGDSERTKYRKKRSFLQNEEFLKKSNYQRIDAFFMSPRKISLEENKEDENEDEHEDEGEDEDEEDENISKYKNALEDLKINPKN